MGESLGPAFFSQLQSSGLTYPSTVESLKNTDIDTDTALPQNIPSDEESSDSNDDDDSMFFSVTSTLPVHLKQATTTINQTPREQAWENLEAQIKNQVSPENNWQDNEEFNIALNTWLSHFPCAMNPDSVAKALKESTANTTSPQEVAELFSAFMAKFQAAETLTPEAPEAVFEQFPDPHQALQTLLIYRHKLVSETTDDNYEETVQKLDQLIQDTLHQTYGSQVKVAAGLDIDTQKADYSRFSKISGLAGQRSPADGLDQYIINCAQADPDGGTGHPDSYGCLAL